MFGINVATFAVMVAGSVLSGSSALLSGTLDNLGDALTYALSMAVVGGSARAKARVAMVKGLLILGAALAVAAQIAWRLTELDAPVASTMSIAAVINLVANAICLKLLTPASHRGREHVVFLGVFTQRCHRGCRSNRGCDRRLGLRVSLARPGGGRCPAGDIPAVGKQGAEERMARAPSRDGISKGVPCDSIRSGHILIHADSLVSAAPFPR